MQVTRSGEISVLGDLATVVALVRSGAARTRPDVARLSGLGRKAVTQRVDQLIALGLLADGQLGPSTGGRAPRELMFCSDSGRVLVCELNFERVSVGLTDLSGRLLAQDEMPISISAGAEVVLGHVERLFDQLIAADAGSDSEQKPAVWGIGIGVLGPVDASAGRPVPVGATVPGWGGYGVRDRLEARYGAPVWLDNEVNLMALGELRDGLGRGHSDLIYLKLGLGIGAGLISGGKLHRGADGTAGEVGHIAVSDEPSATCACGNVGCLVALAGGEALEHAGQEAAANGRSEALARLRDEGDAIRVTDVVAAAARGDRGSIEILTTAGEQVGRVVAMLVNAYNPSLVLIGGEVAAAGDLLLATIRRSVLRRALPLATRNLQVAFSPLSERAGLIGAAFMVLDHLYSPEHLPSWVAYGSPRGQSADIIHAPAAHVA